MPRVCAPYRARRKGKDERGVGCAKAALETKETAINEGLVLQFPEGVNSSRQLTRRASTGAFPSVYAYNCATPTWHQINTYSPYTCTRS
ncbi:hypothetical protein DTW90_36555 [Neorhizobium sp. P12A]|nr:hypothetical protein DTW90_36555 [Neorhizobium sp. P12A]